MVQLGTLNFATHTKTSPMGQVPRIVQPRTYFPQWLTITSKHRFKNLIVTRSNSFVIWMDRPRMSIIS